MSLSVSEHFYSIQGEGPTTGVPAVFLRLRGCNLMCGGLATVEDGLLHDGATWRCDTIEVWLDGTKMTVEQLGGVFEGRGYIDPLRRGAHLVVTGGEPLIQQDGVSSFLEHLLDQHDLRPHVEVETNGTLEPSPGMLRRVDQWNVSPKLANSGMPEGKRVRVDALAALIRSGRTFFKFVVATEADVQEAVDTFVRPFALPVDRVYLMPAAETREELDRIFPIVAELAKQRGYRAGNRMHLQLWDKKTGV